MAGKYNRAMIDDLKMKYPVDFVIEYFGGEVFYNSGGGWSKTRCPGGHEDRRASAQVSPGGDYFNCFACGLEGDVFNIVEALAPNVSGFTEAIEWLERELPPMSTTSS
jgi:DNA primase